MNFIVKIFKTVWYLIWYLFAAVVVLTAAVFGFARLLLPLVGDYNRDVEDYASDLAGRPIKVMSLDAEWHGFSPSLVLNNVRILNRDGNDTILNITRARLDFDLISILISQNIHFKRFALSGVDMSLVRRKTGQVSLSGFEASQLESESDDDTTAILQWLFSQGEMSIHARNLIYQDNTYQGNKANRKRYHFSNVSLVLKNQEDRHLIDGSIGFPENDVQEFAFAVDVTGDLTIGSNWSGSMYASGTNLNVARIFGELGSQGHRVTIGNSNFELWTQWREAKLVNLQGDLSLEKVRWQSGKRFTPVLQSLLQEKIETQEKDGAESIAIKDAVNQPTVVEYHNIIGRFLWDSNEDGWHLSADNFVMARNSRIWPSTQFSVHSFQNQLGFRELDIRANMLRTEDLTPMLPILLGKFGNYSTLADQLSPRGDIRNVNFVWSDAENKFSLAARLDNIGFNPMGKFPGLSGLSGELRTTKHQGSITFKTLGAEFSLPGMFRWDIPIKQLRGQVDWSDNGDQLSVSSRDLELVTEDVETRAIIDLDIPRNDGAPFLSLIVNFEKGDASKASYYYPLPHLEKSVKWLDSAIVQGDIVSGGAIVYGPLDQFPFTEGQGVFETRFKVENGILDYADEWPKIHDLSADVLFRGNSLSVTSSNAKIFNSELTDVKVDIENLRKKPLAIDIQTRIIGKTQEKLNYLIVSPHLNRLYGKNLEALKASGDSELDLKVGLQVKPKKVESRVSGTLSMFDNRLEFTSIPNLLTDINGELKVSHDGLSGKSIKARILGQPGKVSVTSQSSKTAPGQQQLLITGRGKFNARQLSAEYFPVLQDMVDGESGWSARVIIPTSGQENRNVRLKIYSGLKGVELNLPAPFKKRKQDERQLRLSMNIRNAEKALIKAVYGGDFEGVFENVFDSPYLITRGEVRFGGGPVVLPQADGMRITGSMKELSLDIWKNLFKQIPGRVDADNGRKQQLPNGDTDQLPAHLALINSVDLFVNKFTFLEQSATDLKLSVNRKDDWLNINLESEQISGDIIVPKDLAKDHLVFDMEHLHIRTKEGGGGKADPRDFPAIKFNSRFVAYDEKRLGQVAFETSKTDKGMLLQQMIINPRQTTIKGHGQWIIDEGNHHSSLEFELDSKDLGNTMGDLGYVETIEDGSGRVSAKLHWPSTIFDPALAHLSGSVALEFKNGRILDIEPGRAARMFGLFSIQTLPRRLTLDFSDMFSKGLSFDSVVGNFRLEEGDAYTNNFMLKGPNADIALQGRIGLGTQDYDQKIRVTPHITDAAVLLSILTAQPLLLVLQQLLKSDIEGAASIEYALTGSWDNYSLEPIQKSPLLEDDVDEF